MARIAMIGATGLIGQALARLLLGRGHELILIGRRHCGLSGANELVAPPERWPALLDGLALDIAVSTLGTTRKAAGSLAAFESVDRHAVAAFARAARAAGARQFLSVSSVGADPASRSAYLAVKGRAEADLDAIGFERLDIVRPGLLVGERTERRPLERLAMRASAVIDPFLRGPLDRYRAIPAATVAAALAALAGAPGTGRHVHFNADLRALARR